MKKRIVKSIMAAAVVMLLCMMANLIFPIDFSQDYRKISGIENIIFQSNAQRDRFYKRCFWGLVRTEAPVSFSQQKKDEVFLKTDVLQQYINSGNQISQIVVSPDGNYILYCEIDYNYKNTDMTDDEYCYYRVYDVKSKEVITIYEGYKEFYRLDWQ